MVCVSTHFRTNNTNLRTISTHLLMYGSPPSNGGPPLLFFRHPVLLRAGRAFRPRILSSINNNHQEEIFRNLRQWTFWRWYKGVKFTLAIQFLNKFPRNLSRCTFRTSVQWILIDYRKAASWPYFPVSPRVMYTFTNIRAPLAQKSRGKMRQKAGFNPKVSNKNGSQILCWEYNAPTMAKIIIYFKFYYENIKFDNLYY